MNKLSFHILKHSGNAYDGFYYPIKGHLILKFRLFLPGGSLEEWSNNEPMKSFKASIYPLMEKYKVYQGTYKDEPDLDPLDPGEVIAGEHGFSTHNGLHIPLESVIPFLNEVGETFPEYEIKEHFYFITKDELASAGVAPAYSAGVAPAYSAGVVQTMAESKI